MIRFASTLFFRPLACRSRNSAATAAKLFHNAPGILHQRATLKPSRARTQIGLGWRGTVLRFGFGGSGLPFRFGP
jgi:hypothetical protein